MNLRPLVLALPFIALGLQCDKLLDQPAPPPSYKPDNFQEALEALPARTTGRMGKPGDPLNFLFLGSEADIRRALTAAKWTNIPNTIAESVKRGALEWWREGRLDSFPPMQGYRVMNRYQDLNWAQVIVPMETRHHFRLWRTGIRDARDRELWWGSGNFDLSIRWIDLSHRPHPDMNLERQWVQDSLANSPHVEKLSLVALKQIPREGRNDNRYPFTSDGRALLVELK